MLVADLGHFLDMPEDASGSARRLAQHLGDIARAGTAGEVGDPWVSALPCRRRPAHKRCPGRMTIAIAGAEAAAPIRWWCTACDDEGAISNWADTPYDLRRRRPSVAGDVDEVIVSDKTAAVLRELVLLDPDCGGWCCSTPTVSGWCLACAPTPTALSCWPVQTTWRS